VAVFRRFEHAYNDEPEAQSEPVLKEAKGDSLVMYNLTRGCSYLFAKEMARFLFSHSGRNQ
jgi:hypothetical protein